MIKASHLYCLILFLAASLPLKAQSPPSDAINTAADEAVRRAASTIILRNNLQAAQRDQQHGDLIEAARLYEDCFTRAQYIGITAVPGEYQQTMQGLVSVLFELAHRAQEHKDYNRANELYARILVVDPGNPDAMTAQRENKKLLDLQAGTMPSQQVLEQIPAWHTNEVEIATLIQDGKLLYEAGKLDEAEAKLSQAYRRDPGSVAAYQYLQLVKEKRMADATRRTELHSGDAMLQVEQAWNVEKRNGKLEPRPNPFNRTNLVYTSKGRQNILSKLDHIHVENVAYDSLPLGEVINNLSVIAKKRDPDNTGINFFISREAITAAGAAAAPGAIDPATGLPVAPLPTDTGADVGSVTIKISPALNDVRLADVLDAIVLTADKPIKYSVKDYAVVFSLRSPEPVPLEIRTFHVDPNTFRQGLASVSAFDFGDHITTTSGSGGGGGTGGSSGGSSGGGSSGGGAGGATTTIAQVRVAGAGAGGVGGGGQQGGTQGAGISFVTKNASNQLGLLQVSVRTFFTAVGVDFNTNNPANIGKAFVWNDRKGVLTVRATAQDLDLIAAAVETLNQAPPLINIKAKFAEITQDDNRALGFQWTLGNFSIGNSLVGSGGTQASMNGAPSAANPLGFFPGTATAGNSALGIPGVNTLTPPALSDGVVTSGLGNPLNAPTIATLTGILTQPQFQVAMQALEQRNGVDLLTAPEITTESGRQAQIQAVDLETIVTQNTATASSSGGFAGVQNGVNSPIVNQAVLIQPGTQLLPFGPVLDVIPFVSADEFSVQMTIIPTITEFIGYDNPGQFVVQAQQAAGSAPITAQLPLPHFRMRQVTTSVTVWDSQTVVMGGLITDSVTKQKDKVPFLGDMPLLGHLFQSESSSKTKVNLMIFVTPTIINPDGTRYHSDDEMPFLQNQSQARLPGTP
jgi:type II secretory pathway component GspD/PulD (secretin)/tetratricopeptide (TPR) repeat protein